MNIPLLSDLFRWLVSRHREQKLDARGSEKSLADELDSLAEFMDDLLKATQTDGRVVPEHMGDLEFRCRRIWNRWCAILDSRAYSGRDAPTQDELERCIEIAYAAPGAYVQEIYLVQIALGEGTVPPSVRVRFADSIDRLRNLAVKLRLNY